jgi:hypothetical protein
VDVVQEGLSLRYASQLTAVTAGADFFCPYLYAGVSDKRPFLASECETITEAEKWRRELVRDITRKISQIQNGELLFAILIL